MGIMRNILQEDDLSNQIVVIVDNMNYQFHKMIDSLKIKHGEEKEELFYKSKYTE